MKKANWNYVETLITPETDRDNYGCMKIWTLVKRSRQNYNGVACLRENGKVTSDTKERADILNRQFESVFTREDTPTETSRL